MSATAALVTAALVPARAHAETPFTWSQISLGASLDYGASNGVSPYAAGLGLRGGLTLDNGVYVGGSTLFYFGSSEVINGAEEVTDVSEWLVEGGYDLGLMKGLVLRPKLGLGVGSWYWERTLLNAVSGFDSNASNDLVVALGPELVVDLNPVVVSGELRYHHLSGARATDVVSFGVFVGTTLNALFGRPD